MGKKKEMSREDFERGLNSPFYGPGSDARKMLDRYGVAGVKHTHPDGRTGPSRSVDDVKRDLAKAMMNDYDTRRSMEAAAMAGNKDAKKYAKKGFEASTKSLMGGWNTMRDLKKEYVGGGGMGGAKNRAGLTHALVKADRENFIADNDAKYASQADLDSMRDKMKEQGMPGRQETEGMSFNDYMKGTFGSKYEEIARGPALYTDGDQDGGTSLPSPSESSSGETAAAAAAQSNLADTVAGLSAVGGAAANKHKMGMYALGSLTGGV